MTSRAQDSRRRPSTGWIVTIVVGIFIAAGGFVSDGSLTMAALVGIVLLVIGVARHFRYEYVAPEDDES